MAAVLRSMRLPYSGVLALGVFLFIGCGAPRSLLVKMYNAKTDTTLTCSARKGTLQNLEVLYDAVEACARQLEAQGFVRVNEPSP